MIEVFSAGCPVCNDAVEMVKRIACHDCEVSVLDMKDSVVSERAKSLGIRSVPVIAIDGKVADCCFYFFNGIYRFPERNKNEKIIYFDGCNYISIRNPDQFNSC